MYLLLTSQLTVFSQERITVLANQETDTVKQTVKKK